MNSNEVLTVAPSPESVGIDSRAVLRFIERLERDHICIHGFLIIRHGRIAAEGYWKPYTADRLHRMYSTSKSFVSLAVGLMADEGKLSLSDPVIRYFPDLLPDNVHPYVAQTTIRDLLMMATANSANSYTKDDRNWAWTFFNMQPSHPPGSLFSYDTAATVVLNTIVERVSGMPFLEYMRPRLLDPIGFSKDAWCIQTPEGTSWGGSGVLCTLRDMAKVVFVCMNGGRWGDRQLISRDYIAAATSKQIDNSRIHGRHGYGYQIWCEKNNGFSFRGMGSQLAYCMPDRDFLFACIADTQGNGPTGTGIVDAMWQELYEPLSDAPLPENPETLCLLKKKIGSLAFVPPEGNTTSPAAQKIHGVQYLMADNPMGITRMRFTFDGSEGLWEYTNAQGDNRLPFGLGRYIAGKFPQRNYFGRRIGTVPGIQYDCLASAAWVEPHKLNLLVYITDIYLGTLKVSVAFMDNEIAVHMTKVAEWFLDEYQGFAGGTMTGVES
ncbi:MAG: serine hydrolase domain-containing protein [Christensenellales bacterium]|jgi:CubicO group peptidase (beta-lactamase class C family)